MTEPKEKWPRSDSLVVGWAYRRMHRENKNVLIVAVGQTGSGKSWSALKLGEELDKNFSIENVVFTPSDFIKLISETEGKKLKKGAVIVWDEVGVGLGSRDWYSLKNKIISYITQTFRYKNFCVIYTVPAMNFVDFQIRQLFHASLTMTKINRTKGYSTGTFRFLDYSSTKGDIYEKKPRLYHVGKRKRVEVPSMHIGKPSKELVDQYEAKKRDVLENWYKRYQDELKQMQEYLGEGSSGKVDLNELYKKYEENKKKLLDEKGKPSRIALMQFFNLGRTAAYDLQKLITMRNSQIAEAKV
jgi:hypothetical protein